MAIIDDYGAIARRLRELRPAASGEDELKSWRSLAEETARKWVESRRHGPVADMLRDRARQRVRRRV